MMIRWKEIPETKAELIRDDIHGLSIKRGHVLLMIVDDGRESSTTRFGRISKRMM